MQMDHIKMKELVYEVLCGESDLEALSLENCVIQNEFAEGSLCAEAYNRMLAAYSRLCTRLECEEWNDEDIEIIISELRKIGRHLALTMFDYGLCWGSQNRIENDHPPHLPLK